MVYYDANKFVLPEYSFPARAVMNMMTYQFKYNSDDNIITNTDLQYLNVKELLSIILYTYTVRRKGLLKLKDKGCLVCHGGQPF